MARILLVEDYEPVRLLLIKALELDGHTITPAANGAEAIAIFVEHPHDLVITDMEMPFLTGPELIAEIQQLAPSTPIIGMTGGPLRLSNNDSALPPYMPSQWISAHSAKKYTNSPQIRTRRPLLRRNRN